MTGGWSVDFRRCMSSGRSQACLPAPALPARPASFPGGFQRPLLSPVTILIYEEEFARGHCSSTQFWRQRAPRIPQGPALALPVDPTGLWAALLPPVSCLLAPARRGLALALCVDPQGWTDGSGCCPFLLRLGASALWHLSASPGLKLGRSVLCPRTPEHPGR